MSNPVQCVVYREHTLGYIQHDGSIAILHESVLRGAPWRVAASVEPIPYYGLNEIRPATREDFDIYRVSHHADYLVGYPMDQLAAVVVY